MIVIGTDVHKYSHALAAVDAGTGRVRGDRQVKADDAGHLAALRWAAELDDERVWAIEDCRHVSRHLEQALIAAGERVVRVAPHRMGASRRGERQAGKSDPIDALAIARAVVKDGPDAFPAAFLDEHAMEIRLLSDYRIVLVAERTRAQNRLRWNLVALSPSWNGRCARARSIRPPSSIASTVACNACPTSARRRVAREQLAQIRQLTRRIDALELELLRLVKAHRPQLLAETGCGPLTAAILIGRTAGAERFKSDASFARHAGTAPIPCSSGQQVRHRLHRGGDRQLNHALHIIAITRARLDPETRAYLERKQAEGKTKREAIRCLKRHLARRFHRLLTAPTPPAPAQTPIPATAPTPMLCLT